MPIDILPIFFSSALLRFYASLRFAQNDRLGFNRGRGEPVGYFPTNRLSPPLNTPLRLVILNEVKILFLSRKKNISACFSLLASCLNFVNFLVEEFRKKLLLFLWLYSYKNILELRNSFTPKITTKF